MNFAEAFLAGKEGRNFGLPMGISELEKSLDGTQKKSTYTIASSPKVGKSTLVDFCFVLSPYLYSLDHSEIDIEWNYYSFEIDRVQKEFKLASFFMEHDYGIFNFEYNGEYYLMSPRYLLGKLKDERTGQIIPVSEEHEKLLQKIYHERIIPMFGEYSIKGNKIKPGKINFIEEKKTPTEIRKELLLYADKNGTFNKEKYKVKVSETEYETKERIVGYIPKNPNKFTINIIDHVRLMNREKGFSMKDNIDKLSHNEVELRNWCGFTFVNVVHLNRSLTNIDRLRYMGDHIYPTADDIKDSGNLSEDSDVVITMFNPNDDKYGLTKHFGTELVVNGDNVYPNYRSIHVVESRHTIAPDHFFVNMYGNINKFTPLNSF